MSLTKVALFLFLLVVSSSVQAQTLGVVTSLKISVKYMPKSCDFKAQTGDKIKVHYQGKLTDGTVFDSSFKRGYPFEFKLGGGEVLIIKGWEQGLLGMCVGEKRKFEIPAKLGYGYPPTIPGGATLIFDIELIAVNGKPSSSGDEEEVFHDYGAGLGGPLAASADP